MGLSEKFALLASGSPLESSQEWSTRPASYFSEVDASLDSPWIVTDPEDRCRFVGAYSYMNGGGYLRDRVLIGRYCSIGRRVSIGAGAHALAALSTSPKLRGTPTRNYRLDERLMLHPQRAPRPVTTIHSDVWIGDGVVIMPGVTLNVGSVIGANAVVTKDVAPYAIMTGVPASQTSTRFSPDIVARLLRSEWWEAPRTALDNLPCANVFEFLDAIEESCHSKADYPTFGPKRP